MRITHPRLANALHESTNIQTVLEKNDEDLIEYSFKSLRIEGIKKVTFQCSLVFSPIAASEHAGYRNPNLAMSCLKIAICRM